MIKPRFLYNNILRGITPTWSGTAVAAKGPENAVDWLDFTFFEADNGDLDFVMTEDTDIDSWSVYVATYTGTGDEKIELFYESGAGVFSSLGAVDPVGGKLAYNEFTGVTVLSGRKIRLRVFSGTESLKIRQIVVGEVMEAEMGQYVSAVNPIFTQGVRMTNIISQNGSILGRNIKRLERMSELSIEYLTEEWYRSTWEPFARHATRLGFIYIQNYRDYPGECAFSVAESMEQPKNSGNGNRKNVSWQLRNLVADELAV